jgi:hypothetical protein
MVIINIFLLSIYTVLIFSNFFFKTITLGEIWQKVHINSLIGLQKIIEKWEFKNNFDLEIWYYIILPILEIPILFAFTIILTFILAFKILRRK